MDQNKGLEYLQIAHPSPGTYSLKIPRDECIQHAGSSKGSVRSQGLFRNWGVSAAGEKAMVLVELTGETHSRIELNG